MNEVIEPKLLEDLSRQLREELRSESDNPVNPATLFVLKQKFGMLPLPSVAEIARQIKGGK